MVNTNVIICRHLSVVVYTQVYCDKMTKARIMQ